MPVVMIYPNAGALKIAEYIQADLADAELALFQVGSVVLSPATTLAELEAAEADFTGYARAAIAAWLAPLLNPLGGAGIETGTKQFAIASPFTTPNSIQGWFVVDTDGDLICAGEFPDTITLVGAGDGIPLNVQIVFG